MPLKITRGISVTVGAPGKVKLKTRKLVATNSDKKFFWSVIKLILVEYSIKLGDVVKFLTLKN